MKKSTFAVAALSLALAGVASAQNAQNPATNPGSQKVAPPPKFSALDTNKDGRVSSEEARGHVELVSSFVALDTNKDAYLSESEFSKWSSPPAASPPAASPPPAMPPADAASPPARLPGDAPKSAPDDKE